MSPFPIAPPRSDDRDAWMSLQENPHIDGDTAHDLMRLGIRRGEDLTDKDPLDLYRRLSALDQESHDVRKARLYAMAIEAARREPDLGPAAGTRRPGGFLARWRHK
ncbi:MAG: Pathogenicity locus [Thermoplasmata archaeon]|jgi:hypothetical protein|nr:Pathogenicity locus [Thermoplasmata archaeon]